MDELSDENRLGDLVLMNTEVYEAQQARLEIYEKLAEAEQAVRDDAVQDAADSLKCLRKKYRRQQETAKEKSEKV